jgi:hypothetical protein
MTILFENHQWAVTSDGLETINPGPPPYPIEAHRLLDKKGAGEGKLYDWPVHMAKKFWVDIEAFIAAFSEALRLHDGKYEGQVNRDILEASILEARRVSAERLPVREDRSSFGQTQAFQYPEEEALQYPEKKRSW